MIQFITLKINQEDTLLTIQAQVKDETYYSDVYIDRIVIDSNDTFIENGPSTSPVYNTTLVGDVKDVTLSLTSDDVTGGLAKKLLFVYVITKGTPGEDVPEGEDNAVTLKAVANLYPFYINSISYLKELNSNTEIPDNFIRSILLQKSIELALNTGHYTEAITNWSKYFIIIDAAPFISTENG